MICDDFDVTAEAISAVVHEQLESRDDMKRFSRGYVEKVTEIPPLGARCMAHIGDTVWIGGRQGHIAVCKIEVCVVCARTVGRADPAGRELRC